jgi:hypothetical protein
VWRRAPALDSEAVQRQPGIAALTLTAWRLRQEDVGEALHAIPDIKMVGDDNFEPIPHSALVELAAQGLDGTWLPQGYDVIGPAGHIEVVIDFDELTGSLRVDVANPDACDLVAADLVLTIMRG